MSDNKKFFFDLHNFNDDAEEEEGPPPPPTFNEEELAKAKDDAYKKGRQDGFNESQESIEKKISLLLEHAKTTFLEFQTTESEREKIYEQEAVQLSLELFHSIYPDWIETKGKKEVENAIIGVLSNVSGQQNIKIEVSPELLEPIEERLKPIREKLSDISISLQANNSLDNNDMRMKWDNGGAIRDSKKLAAQILQRLENELDVKTSKEDIPPEEDLADVPETRHNKDIKTETSDE